MSKRSTNLNNLLNQKEILEVKMYELQRQLVGINKSISRIESADSKQSTSENSSETKDW